MGDIALLRLPHAGPRPDDLLGGGVDLDARRRHVALLRQRVPPDGEEDGVVLVGGHRVAAGSGLPGDFDAAALGLLHCRWDAPSDKLGALLFHVGAYVLRTLLVKAAQRNGAHHDCRVVLEPCEEACALEGDVRGPHHQRLPWRLVEREQVVGRDAQLPLVGDAKVLGASARGDDDFCCGLPLLHALLVRQLDRVVVYKRAKRVDVSHPLRPKLGPVGEVEGANVVLDVVHHRAPVVRQLPLVRSAPPKLPSVVHGLAEKTCLMHELLGNAANIYAGSSKSPACAFRGRRHIIAHRDLCAESARFLRTCQPPRAAPNDQ
mmetsp:Transcript_27158/g.55354  ORF Transcript_27158/g.55354 Transcript_27158/m.55354 type:complete len:319 (+) Transcript_27158:1196-2152(+)